MVDLSPSPPESARPYRGRLAPTPTGHLHLGHAKTFWIAQRRAEQAGGTLILRIEDLDRDRCKPQYANDLLEDLTWFGFRWQEGPDVGGEAGPYIQQARRSFYQHIWRRLSQTGAIYPSPHSRKDVALALSAPQEGDREVIFPPKLRPATWEPATEPGNVNWRFRVLDGETITFTDENLGTQSFTAGKDFGDFIVWRRDGFPSYELAVVADDHAMEITEVVRGEDLLLSSAKQILLYRTLGWEIPAFYHCPLVRDEEGRRLAKRDKSRSLRSLRHRGVSPEQIRTQWTHPNPLK
ncbi:tRNA glutamyl-Q synthetase [filamentous cyanobacterium CCP5]|nr:tRNA glutamyl-Q synthetase [filamentous cyanobacterium CCP5]